MLDILSGRVGEGMRMHPMALPLVIDMVALFVIMVAVTWLRGSPVEMWKTRPGRYAIYVFLTIHVGSFVLWIARWCGAFGGPVPV